MLNVPADDKLSLIGAWSGHCDPLQNFVATLLQSYHWNGWT